jgi:hypothetical protein
MKRSPHVDNIKLGKGQLFLFPIVNGVRAADAIHFGNCQVFETGLEDETIEVKSSMNKSAATLKKVTSKRAITLRISGQEQSKANLALVTMGTETTLNQTGGAVTAEPLAPVVVLGGYYQTAERGISLVSLEETTGPTPLVLGTDYEIVDAEAGIIRILETAVNVAAGDEVEIDYTSAAVTAADKVSIGTETVKEGTLLFLADNQSGDNVEVRLPRVSFTPEGNTGFISDEVGNWTLNGEILDDSAGLFGGSAGEPFGYVLDRA